MTDFLITRLIEVLPTYLVRKIAAQATGELYSRLLTNFEDSDNGQETEQ